jgi:TolB-like protein
LAGIGIGILILVGGFFGYRYFQSAGAKQITSIAVLPFENSSGNPDSEYLSDGIAESLIYRLSQIPELKVSTRSSVFRFKGKDVDAEKVGAELGVDAIMSGRIVQRGDSLTISVDLVDVRNKKTLWGEQFERKMSDLLVTQREIASAITEKLQLKLTGDAAKSVTKRYTDNNEAYQSYLKGRYYWNRRTAINLKKALDEFRTATEKDPNFALAFVGLADCYALLSEYAGAPSSETIPKAKSYAERALALDGQLAEVHATLGLLADYSWQWAEAEREFKVAIEINPNYPTTYHWYSISLKAQGRYDEADKIIRRAEELDPVSSVIAINVTRMLQLQKKDDAAIQYTQKLIGSIPLLHRPTSTSLSPTLGRGGHPKPSPRPRRVLK